MILRLDVAVKERFNISRQKAKTLIEDGKVLLNGKPVLKPSAVVSDEDELTLERSDVLKYVGRGGLKLEGALKSFGIDPTDFVCLDIGASTGGFTDCLLQNGARLVYALDVGTSQLAESLKVDKRVISMENTDIRTAVLPQAVDFICMDVSFISVTKILSRFSELLKPNGTAVVLVKPQFEAGREALGKKGVVRDAKAHRRVLKDVVGFAEGVGLAISGLTHSPVKGGDGNVEYLLYLANKDEPSVALNIDMVVKSAFDSLK
jgi:23S rRNA (cytidine1920-2'-O)/16S rRNA (cytidine1409-2'-O)-methyltransferase